MNFEITDRILSLKAKVMNNKRYVSIEQAKIITEAYQQYPNEPRIIQRAYALNHALSQLEIKIDEEELIVGNRTINVRDGIVFPESGCNWINQEIDTMHKRPQDPFFVHDCDKAIFKKDIYPYWQDKSMENIIRDRYGKEIDAITKVAKINQKDHAQGHICPDCTTWLASSPKQLKEDAIKKLEVAKNSEQENFYQSIIIVMEGVESFMLRYAKLAREIIVEKQLSDDHSLHQVANNCEYIATQPPKTFHQAVQSLWFLFTILHMESNASSFSPGRMDKYLYPFYQHSIDQGMDNQEALEIIESLWIKFNEIVYLRNSHSAKYFAGFPIGFNIALGGVDEDGNAYENELSYLCLEAQKHLGLPQPNLSVRLSKMTSQPLLNKAIDVVALGSGMPQFFNDESVIDTLVDLGIDRIDALDYAIVGCVEITTQGNNLGWSDAAMFNLNKALELTLNNGKCLLTNEQMGLDLGNLTTFENYEEIEIALKKQINYFIEKMIKACEVVEQAHQECLPSPFLSSVIEGCMEKGIDVTRGGAKYNFSGIQMIQVANLADSLAVLKELVFEQKTISKEELFNAIKDNYEGHDMVHAIIENTAPRYGNDIAWVDELGANIARYFKKELTKYKNYRGGKYHTGMYTVSAHVPMGENVGASVDGRRALEPLADGGMSPVYGRDVLGPTAILKSVSRLDNDLTSNGGLLNMKFLPTFFNEDGKNKFSLLLRSFVDLEIPHIQFNVVNAQDLLAAKENPEKYRSLTIRVAGYTAYFVELDHKLQDEIIARTCYENI